MIVWEQDGKRAYRFENGDERVFSVEYCGMFEPVQFESVEQRAEGIKLLAKVEQDVQNSSSSRGAPQARGLAWSEQVAIFRRLFPTGFAGEQWQDQYRGREGQRRLKRHRTAAMVDAQARLGVDAFTNALESGQFSPLFDAAADVLAQTDLVTTKQLEPLRTAQGTRGVVSAFRDWLHNPLDASGQTFDTFLRELSRHSRGSCTWPLMTAMPALLDPEHHVCIHPRFGAQAKILSRTARPPKAPSGRGYVQFVQMVEDARDRLRADGLQPVDLMDVREFIALTLKPSSSHVLTDVRADAVAAESLAPLTH